MNKDARKDAAEGSMDLIIEAILKNYKKMGCFYMRELYPQVFRFFNAGVHMDLFVGTEKALLWDTGNGYADLKSAVRQITDLPLVVVNSHGHLDHTCGNYQFDGPIYIHPEDMEICRLHNSHGMRTYQAIMASAMKGGSGLLSAVPDDFDADSYIDEGCGDLTPVREGHVFDLGGKTLAVIELPGHTKGSIGLIYREKRVLFSGDAVNNNMMLFFDHSTPLSVYRKTLQKALAADFDEMVVSHGFSPVPKERLEIYLEVARNPDFENGIPHESVHMPENADVRVCVRKGYKKDDLTNPGYAALTISRELLEK